MKIVKVLILRYYFDTTCLKHSFIPNHNLCSLIFSVFPLETGCHNNVARTGAFLFIFEKANTIKRHNTTIVRILLHVVAYSNITYPLQYEHLRDLFNVLVLLSHINRLTTLPATSLLDCVTYRVSQQAGNNVYKVLNVNNTGNIFPLLLLKPILTVTST